MLIIPTRSQPLMHKVLGNFFFNFGRFVPYVYAVVYYLACMCVDEPVEYSTPEGKQMPWIS